MANKKFKDLEPGEPIYFIDPKTQKVESFLIEGITLNNPKYPGHCVIVYTPNIPKVAGMDGVKEKNIFLTDDEHGKAFHKGKPRVLVFPYNDEMVTTMTNPPTVYCTSKSLLELWMIKTR